MNISEQFSDEFDGIHPIEDAHKQTSAHRIGMQCMGQKKLAIAKN